MDFQTKIIDPTEIRDVTVDVVGTVYGWAVNRDTNNAILFIRCWRSDLAREQGRQPLLDTQLQFSAQDQGPEVIEYLHRAWWEKIGNIISAKIRPK